LPQYGRKRIATYYLNQPLLITKKIFMDGSDPFDMMTNPHTKINKKEVSHGRIGCTSYHRVRGQSLDGKGKGIALQGLLRRC
jgi:hypothetical protein